MLFANIDILDENLDHKHGMFVGTEGSHITYVGTEEPADTARFGERYDGTGKLLMSAFYNTHAHTPMTLLRGYAENQPLQQWLNDTVWPFGGQDGHGEKAPLLGLHAQPGRDAALWAWWATPTCTSPTVDPRKRPSRRA